jgi:hypothetical protein
MQTKKPLPRALQCFGMGLLAAVATAASAATPDSGKPDIAARAPTGLELIAFEVPGCAYCPVFRRDVAPSYAASRAGKAAPLRYVDLNDAAADSFRLSAPITVVPTLVLVKDGVEVGRIAGYAGRENVHRLLAPLLPPD